MPDQDPEIIDSAEWLRQRAEEAIAGQNSDEAITWLQKLLGVGTDSETLFFAHSNLGSLLFRERDIDKAREHFRSAESLAPTDASMAYALGHCEATNRFWWGAFYYFTKAVFHARSRPSEVVEFMRSAAVSARYLGLTDLAESMLLGARERSPLQPQVLESLGRLYETQERWLEAIRMRDELIEVLKGNDPRRQVRLLSPAIESAPPNEELATQKANDLSAKLRSGFQVVDEETVVTAADAHLSRTTHPAGMHTLIHNLESRARAVEMLETAQVLWAKAHHDRFDVHLTPHTLAAAIQWIVERYHWSVPTPPSDLETLFRVDAQQVQAAVRLLVGKFNMQIIPSEFVSRGLGGNDGHKLSTILRAYLLDVELDTLEAPRMLS